MSAFITLFSYSLGLPSPQNYKLFAGKEIITKSITMMMLVVMLLLYYIYYSK